MAAINIADRLADVYASDKLGGWPQEMLDEVEKQSLHTVEDLSLLSKDDIDNCATFTLGMKSKLKHVVALIKQQLQQEAGGDFDSQSQSVSGFDTFAEDDESTISSVARPGSKKMNKIPWVVRKGCQVMRSPLLHHWFQDAKSRFGKEGAEKVDLRTACHVIWLTHADAVTWQIWKNEALTIAKEVFNMWYDGPRGPSFSTDHVKIAKSSVKSFVTSIQNKFEKMRQGKLLSEACPVPDIPSWALYHKHNPGCTKAESVFACIKVVDPGYGDAGVTAKTWTGEEDKNAPTVDDIKGKRKEKQNTTRKRKPGASCLSWCAL